MSLSLGQCLACLEVRRQFANICLQPSRRADDELGGTLHRARKHIRSIHCHGIVVMRFMQLRCFRHKQRLELQLVHAIAFLVTCLSRCL